MTSPITSNSQALVVGLLLGMLLKYSDDPNRPLLIDEVHGHVNPAGDYEPFLTLQMRSGTRLLVSVATLP